MRAADAEVPLARQVGVMMQLEIMLGDKSSFGDRAGEVDRQFALLEQAGVKWVRQGIMWEQIEPQPGKWNWSAADRVVQAAGKHHIHLLWLVGNTAPWDSDNGQWNGVPKDLGNNDGHFVHFLQQLVGRYKGSVHHWEIRNEPNLEYMWHGRKAERYALYLTEAHRVIKNHDPKATVVFGGLGGGMMEQTSWFREVLAALHKQGKALPFDVANFHVYAGEADRKFTGADSVQKYLTWCNERIKETMNAENLAKMPVWITELDYPAAPKHQAQDPGFQHGEESQAKLIRELLPGFAQTDPQRRVFWASLLDDFDDAGAFASVGLFHSDKQHHIGKARPAYQALRHILNASQ